jgi:hypothetical protein
MARIAVPGQVKQPKWIITCETVWESEIFRFPGELNEVLQILAEVLEPDNIKTLIIEHNSRHPER